MAYTFLCRYLVDSRWFKQWKKDVGFESWEADKAGTESMHPGPVDNSGLFKGMKQCMPNFKLHFSFKGTVQHR